MRITKIEPQKKRPGRKNIYADGQFVAGVSDETLLRLALRTGDELGPDTLKVLQRTEELHHAKSVALRFLSTRPRTEREMRDKLREKEFADDEISRTIDELKASGVLNDLEFARAFIRDSLALKPLGRVAIARKLLLLGITKETAAQTLDEAFASVDPKELALEAGRRFLRKAGTAGKRTDPRKLKARLSSFLLRHGYTWDIAGPVVKLLVDEEATDDDRE